MDSFPLSKIEQVIVTGKGSISLDLLKKMGEMGTDLVILRGGKVVCKLSSREIGTVKTRKEQYYAHLDERSGHLAKAFVYSKIRNQYSLLGTIAKSRVDTNPEVSEEIQKKREEIKGVLDEVSTIEDKRIDEIRSDLMKLEARGAKEYWESISLIIPEEIGFSGRRGIGDSPRYARDGFNASLNLGYSLLEGVVWRAVQISGLDPYGGFLHVDRPGRASMVLDVMEEFRQQLVDRVIIPVFTKREITEEDFSYDGKVCMLGEKARRLVISRVLGKIENGTVYYRNSRIKWDDLILKKCREIVKYLRREIGEYRPFYLRW